LFSLNLFLKWEAAFLRILRLFKKFRDSGMPIKVGRHTAGHGHSEMDAEISADQCMRVRIKFMNYWIYENMNITYAPRAPSRSHCRQNYLRQTKTEDNRTGRTYSYAEKNRRRGEGVVVWAWSWACVCWNMHRISLRHSFARRFHTLPKGNYDCHNIIFQLFCIVCIKVLIFLLMTGVCSVNLRNVRNTF